MNSGKSENAKDKGGRKRSDGLMGRAAMPTERYMMGREGAKQKGANGEAVERKSMQANKNHAMRITHIGLAGSVAVSFLP